MASEKTPDLGGSTARSLVRLSCEPRRFPHKHAREVSNRVKSSIFALPIEMNGGCLLLLLLLLVDDVRALTDFTLSCQRGYKVSAIRRFNSLHQVNKAGSLVIECQSIETEQLDSVSSCCSFHLDVLAADSVPNADEYSAMQRSARGLHRKPVAVGISRVR